MEWCRLLGSSLWGGQSSNSRPAQPSPPVMPGYPNPGFQKCSIPPQMSSPCVLNETTNGYHSTRMSSYRNTSPQPDDSSSVCECCKEEKYTQTAGQALVENPEMNAYPSYLWKKSRLLQPVHRRVQFHLAYDNLLHEQVKIKRKNIDKDKCCVFLHELYDSGEIISPHGTFRWASEVYYLDGQFYQKENISCFAVCGQQNFRGCPHQNVEVRPKYRSSFAQLRREADVENSSECCDSHGNFSRCSKQGDFFKHFSCEICYSNTALSMREERGSLQITFTCYRMLGAMEDLDDPKWVSLTRGQGVKCRPKHDVSIAALIWAIAYRLQRPNLSYDSQYWTPDGYMPLHHLAWKVINDGGLGSDLADK